MARILVTRNAPDAAVTADLLRKDGHEPIVAPLRELAMQHVTFPPEKPDFLIATSRNAFVAAREFPGCWRECPIFCVGVETARAAAAAGFRHVWTAEGDAASLRDAVARTIRSEMAATSGAPACFYLAGEPRRIWLETELRRLGVRVETLICYAMTRVPVLPEAARVALAAGQCDAVLHFSTESMRAFFDLSHAAGLSVQAAHPIHACLSPAIARQAAKIARSEIRVIATPEKHMEALIALVRAHLTP